MPSIFSDLQTKAHQLGSQLKSSMSTPAPNSEHSHTHKSGQCSDGLHKHSRHRYHSFAPQREGNQLRWYVDGCSYMWAVSVALEQARESIWILDWWLSPELYLRRPPAQNEKYRLDKMLLAAAQRGVKVRIVVYKEVTQALTISSAHSKHALEALHENIAVFRHPDHLPDTKVLGAHLLESLASLKLTPSTTAKLPKKTVASIYGTSGGTVLYWAHHEKLCLIDGETAFMGGLDLCFGRWDTHQHSLADSHPGDARRNVFPGQDFNNARVMDFEDVPHWENNNYSRTTGPRMAWSDISLSLRGPTVLDLQVHFAERWNFIMGGKYSKKNKGGRYEEIEISHSMRGAIDERDDQPDTPSPVASPGQGRAGADGQPYYPPPPTEPAASGGEDSPGFLRSGVERITKHVEEIDHQIGSKIHGRHIPGIRHMSKRVHGERLGGATCQLTRSVSEWSHGVEVEHSIANAYIDAIRNAEHFIYIENQFFITATSPEQKPVSNLIGGALVERIRQAHAKGDGKFKIIVVIPSVPAFAGDLRSDAALSTRAIMEFQYDSICRDQKNKMSIYETLERYGIDASKWIKFYNLRAYDRVAKYAGTDGGRWDSVAECYMLNGPKLTDIPWNGTAEEEMEAFVSEELYVHSKVMIIDDRTVICGSANLNDRSQLGDHDSEIAIVINDPTPCPEPAYMAGKVNKQASRFATSLRRTLFRRHLGLLKPQDFTLPNSEYLPVGNGPSPDETYDWGTREDYAVADPFDPKFEEMWWQTARTNTEIFRQVFRPVPDDTVDSWAKYDEFYSSYFTPRPKEGGKEKDKEPAKYQLGHVISERFDHDVGKVKQLLAQVRGTLVEMPLHFLEKEDIAQEGVGLNALTEEIYT